MQETNPLSVEQADIVEECKSVLDGILKVNYGKFASLIMYPLSDPAVRQAIYDLFSYSGYRVAFSEHVNNDGSLSNRFYIDLYRRGGSRKPEQEETPRALAATAACGLR